LGLATDLLLDTPSSRRGRLSRTPATHRRLVLRDHVFQPFSWLKGVEQLAVEQRLILDLMLLRLAQMRFPFCDRGIGCERGLSRLVHRGKQLGALR
jgi:hypothetical protein